MSASSPYRPVDSKNKEIRLLGFETVSGAEEGDSRASLLACGIIHASLVGATPIKYNAISYCWGADTASTSVLLDGHEAQVPLSAQRALRAVSRAQHGLELPVWIDAICINQKDVTEKSAQVANMRDVYAKAQTVFICLGEDDDNAAEVAIESIYSVLAESYQSCRRSDDRDAIVAACKSEAVPIYQAPLVPDRFDYWAVESFFSAPWFTRVWTIQEAILSKRPICLRGSRSVPWIVTAAFAATVVRTIELKPENPEDLRMTFLALYDAVRLPNQTYVMKKLHADVGIDLKQMFGFKVFDIRDYLYGVLGLLKLERFTPSIRNRLRPDYRKSAEQVLVDLTVTWIELCGSLEILKGPVSHLQLASPLQWKLKPSLLPSWVPRYDWHFTPEGQALALLPWRLYDAHDSHPLEFSLTDSNVLRLRGVIVDSVTVNSELFWDTMQKPSTSHPRRLLRSLERGLGYAMTLSRRGDARKNFLVSLAMTHAVGQSHEQVKAEDDSQFLNDFAAFVMYHLQISAALESYLLSIGAKGGSAEHYQKAFSLCSLHRSCFMTDGGRLGLGMPPYQRGDKICIMFGASAPFILRSNGKRWSMRGDAYVQGIMQGNIIQQLRREGRLEREAQWFEIE